MKAGTVEFKKKKVISMVSAKAAVSASMKAIIDTLHLGSDIFHLLPMIIC